MSYTHLQTISNFNSFIVKPEDLYQDKNYPTTYEFIATLTKNTFNSKDFFNFKFNIRNYIKTNAALNYYISDVTASIANVLIYTAKITSTSIVITGQNSIEWYVVIVDDTTPYDTTTYYFDVESSQLFFNSSVFEDSSFDIKKYIKTTSGLSYSCDLIFNNEEDPKKHLELHH